MVLLFGSFFKPITILSALPLSIAGAMVALLLWHSELSIPSMIGLFMLMGIAAKNSILLVEYAIEREREGASQREALMEACRERARPIVMTTLAMMAGMLPTALGIGEGSEFRQPMAVAVIGGLITSTVLSLVLVPVVYEFVDDFEAWLTPKLRPADHAEGAAGRAVAGDGDGRAPAGRRVGRVPASRAAVDRRAAGRRARAAAPRGSCSSSSGFAAGAWAPLVPFAKQRLALSDGALGLALLCLGLGSIVAMPLAGALAARLGCRRVLLVARRRPRRWSFRCWRRWAGPRRCSGALFLFGVGIGSVDCVINIQAIVVERDSGRAMMSGFHALYSLGGFAGAAAVSG